MNWVVPDLVRMRVTSRADLQQQCRHATIRLGALLRVNMSFVAASLKMPRPWTWTKTWQSPVTRKALLEIAENVVQELQRRDYSSRDLFGCRLGFEEALVERIHTKAGADDSGNIEITCGGTMYGFQLYVAGKLRYESEHG